MPYTPEAPFTPSLWTQQAKLHSGDSRLIVDNVPGALGTGSANGHPYTVTGVTTDDVIVAVQHISTAAAVATIEDLNPADFEISAADTILDHSGAGQAGADYSSDQLQFIVEDVN